jgi:hypothetical protein
MKFDTIDYLKTGNARQQRAYDVLTNHRILAQLAPFSPVLVGTIPINIDIESSDLDVICQWFRQRRICGGASFIVWPLPQFYLLGKSLLIKPSLHIL